MLDQIDYKGKWFILQDQDTPDDYGMDYIIDQISIENIDDEFLREHCENCIYYGIPAYIGVDKELHKRIEIIEHKLHEYKQAQSE